MVSLRLSRTPKPVSMNSRRITQVVLVMEIALIVLLHINKSNQSEKQTIAQKNLPAAAASSASPVVFTSILK